MLKFQGPITLKTFIGLNPIHFLDHIVNGQNPYRTLPVFGKQGPGCGGAGNSAIVPAGSAQTKDSCRRLIWASAAWGGDQDDRFNRSIHVTSILCGLHFHKANNNMLEGHPSLFKQGTAISASMSIC